jgi:hypothetical protein
MMKIVALVFVLALNEAQAFCPFFRPPAFVAIQQQQQQTKAASAVLFASNEKGSSNDHEEKQTDPYCIPLEEICLKDLPKVGGYVIVLS